MTKEDNRRLAESLQKHYGGDIEAYYAFVDEWTEVLSTYNKFLFTSPFIKPLPKEENEQT